MRTSLIEKTLDASDITDEQLRKISRYTRRQMNRNELFVFSVILCDNEIDRDCERFPVASLERLGELFLGKAGVFDHMPKAENQSARIFDTKLVQTAEVNSVGEPYCQLRAWAYMVRCDKNADLILEIDAGIKKEVSVGCSVESVLCSICGEEQRNGGCNHGKGEVYGGQLCYHLLVNPTDAYEWSFVAVPAQKNAGVTKRRGGSDLPGNRTVPVEKARLNQLERLAELGERYENELRASVIKLGLLGQPELEAEELKQIVARLDAPQLEALRKSFNSAAVRRYPLMPQTAPGGPEQSDDGSFRI